MILVEANLRSANPKATEARINRTSGQLAANLGSISRCIRRTAHGRRMRPISVFYKTFRDFPVGTGVELDPDGGVPKVNPVADVPRPDPSRIRKALQHRRQPTDAEDAAHDGK